MNHRIELLSPASDLEKIKYALLYGSDAIYVGGPKYSLRTRDANLSLEELKEASDLVHSYNKVLYVTTNIYPEVVSEEELLQYLKYLESIKVDAIISSSLIIISTALKYTNLEVHLSTQRNTTNSIECNYFQELGVKRVVLARELDLGTIALLRENTSVDLEVFIHGATCSSYSGLCELSLTLTNRNANLGACSQSCRWLYSSINKEKVFENTSISGKDLVGVDFVNQLIEVGIQSLKIEGRMKSLHYICSITRTYRYLIDCHYKGIQPDLAKVTYSLSRAENRQLGTNFFDLEKKDNIIYQHETQTPNQLFIGLVLGRLNEYLIVEVRNFFTIEDKLESFTPDFDFFEITDYKILDKNFNNITICNHPKEIVYLETKVIVPNNSFLRRIEK
jgi:putative protease